jgi:hypothetical protein
MEMVMVERLETFFLRIVELSNPFHAFQAFELLVSGKEEETIGPSKSIAHAIHIAEFCASVFELESHGSGDYHPRNPPREVQPSA